MLEKVGAPFAVVVVDSVSQFQVVPAVKVIGLNNPRQQDVKHIDDIFPILPYHIVLHLSGYELHELVISIIPKAPFSPPRKTCNVKAPERSILPSSRCHLGLGRKPTLMVKLTSDVCFGFLLMCMELPVQPN